MGLRKDPFVWVSVSFTVLVLLFLLVPLAEMVTEPTLGELVETMRDRDVWRAIRLSLVASCAAGAISLVFGTPFAYLLARKNFPGKRLLESVVDLPIMIPHPVVGIAILSIAGRNHWIGRVAQSLGVEIMGTVTGLITVLTFVGLPFYVNTVKAGIEQIPPRLENVSRSLGAGRAETFRRVTLPLAWRGMLVGFILCTARAISEFGAVVIVAYHPMVGSVLIYERFTAYGLKYSQPVAVWLIFVSLVLFACLRIVSHGTGASLSGLSRRMASGGER